MTFVVPLLLAAFALFCGYGFLASGELSDPGERWLWRAGYALLGLASLVGFGLFLRRDSSADQG